MSIIKRNSIYCELPGQIYGDFFYDEGYFKVPEPEPSKLPRAPNFSLCNFGLTKDSPPNLGEVIPNRDKESSLLFCLAMTEELAGCLLGMSSLNSSTYTSCSPTMARVLSWGFGESMSAELLSLLPEYELVYFSRFW